MDRLARQPLAAGPTHATLAGPVPPVGLAALPGAFLRSPGSLGTEASGLRLSAATGPALPSPPDVFPGLTAPATRAKFSS